MISIKKIWQGLWHKSKNGHSRNDFPPIGYWATKLIKHQPGNGLRHYNAGGCKLYYKSPYTLLHLYPTLFEQQIYRFDTENAYPVILDCGANIGLSVAYFKWLYPESRVYAFEPDKENLEILHNNVSGNGFKNVTVFDEAVWVHNDGISFLSDGSLGSRISALGSSIVNSVRLSDVLQEFECVDFLKIDIEGAEFEVLKDLSASKQLAKINNMFVEYHGDFNESKKLMEMLSIIHEYFDVNISNALDSLEQPFIRRPPKYGFDVQLNIFCLKK